ncbi:MAG TPA: LytR C-terminal domain-containing protein [Cellulomonas sp.]
MSKGSYPYPEDEFDAVPAQDTPTGVHRAPRSWWSRWWAFVTVPVVVSAATVGFVLWASSWSGDLSSLTGSSSVATTEATDAATDSTATAEATDATTEAPVETEEPVAEADLSTSVSVLNAASVSGLAAGAAEQLATAGFTAVTTGNGTASGRTVSTVYYASADQATTAQLVADTLGITTVTEDATEAGDAITVLLLSDYDS